MTDCDVKIQWRRDYGDVWKTIIGPHPVGLSLVHKMRKLHVEDPTKHLACYVDGALNMAWTPEAFRTQPEIVEIDGVRYVPQDEL